jgi:hypothetical protein
MIWGADRVWREALFTFSRDKELEFRLGLGKGDGFGHPLFFVCEVF